MSDQNALIPGLENLPVSKYADDKSFDSVSNTGSYLPRVQIMGGNSDLVQEGKINVGRVALIRSKTSYVDLGSEASFLVLSWRPKALRIVGGDVTSAYDPENKEFKKIAEESDIQDSGCMFGPEFLIYVPSEKCFATYHMASKTARRKAAEMRALMRRWATLGVEVIKAKGYTWQGPIVKICNTSYDVPPGEEILAAVERFANLPQTETETAPESSGRER
jgi:hypothetical protein